MALAESDDENITNTLNRILDLSYRISIHSFPMKPFIRFSKQAEDIYKQGKSAYSNLFWDFDYALQKILLGVANEIATPEQLDSSCIERCKENLDSIYMRRRKELERHVESGNPYSFSLEKRDKFIFERIKPKSRFLYLECGSGMECLKYASQGYNVIGIDTNFRLVNVTNDWAEYLAIPFKAICMDDTMLGFSQGVFDSFFLGFYGQQPLLSKTLALQKNLAEVLNDGGIGFVFANRKKYQSFWFSGAHYYKEPMNQWLCRQSYLDCYFSETDEYEEQLNFGLYWRTHTLDSLSTELSFSFDILECVYEKHDPRHLVCLVKRKENPSLERLSEDSFEYYCAKKIHLDLSSTSIQEILIGIDHICNFLETHEEKVSQFFDEYNTVKEKNPILCIKTELSGFIEILNSVFKSLPN